MSVRRLLASVLFVALACPASARAAEIVDPLACPNATQLRNALDRHALQIDGQLELRASGSHQAFLIWQSGMRRFTRKIRLSARDCAAAAETAALLVSAWQRKLPTSAQNDPLSEAAHVHASDLPDAGSSSPTPAIPEVDAGPSAPASTDAGATNPEIGSDAGSGSIDAGIATPAPADAGAPPPPIAPDAGPAVAEVPLVAVAAPEESSPRWHLVLGAEGRGELGVDPSHQLAAGALAVEVNRAERFGAAIDVAIDSGQSATISGTQSVSTGRQTAALRGIARFRPFASHASGTLRLSAGPMLERLAAQSQGFPSATSVEAATTYDPGLALSASYEERLGPISLTIGPESEVLFKQAILGPVDSSGNVVPEITLPVLWLGLAVGIQIHIF